MKRLSSIILATLLVSGLSFTALAVDSQNPGNVNGLSAEALNAAVKLTWIAATDDTGVDGYKVHYGLTSVTAQGQAYDFNVDAGNVLEYTVSNLENGTKYYFSVVAADAAGNESIRWATEVSATPDASAGSITDSDAPQVADAEAVNKEQVKVEFSEEIVLPQEDPQDAFTIENEDTFEPLVVSVAEMDEEDETGKTVIITTDVQDPTVTYKLTVSIDIKDKSGNPIISGTSDTAIFTGSGLEREVEDNEGPILTKAESVDNTHITLTFNETVVLSIDPSENFIIKAENDESKTLEVLGVQLGINSAGTTDSAAIITTSPQEGIKYVVTVAGLKDETGNESLIEENASVMFDGMAEADGEDGDDEPADDEEDEEEPADIIAPEDVANFLAEKVLEAEKYLVTLKWDFPVGDTTDSVEQIIYKSENLGENYDKKASVDPGVEEYEAGELEAGEYWFKITQKDLSGNESEGSVVKVILAETGPGLIGLVLVSLGLGRIVGKRKRF